MLNKEIRVKNLKISNRNDLVLIAGPSVIESESTTLKLAEQIKIITEDISMPFIFKSSYDKGNRTSIKSYRGPGLKEGLKVLSKVKNQIGIPVLTDIHDPSEAEPAAEVVDILQIPAFLSRQTDLIVAAAKTSRPVNVKKGQFMAPWNVKHIIEKIKSEGNDKTLLTERGTFFGYNNLVVDMRSFPIMASFGCPVIFDVTHSLQEPGARTSASGGQPEYISYLASAAVAAGIAGLFIEVHPLPDKALSDGESMLKLKSLKKLLSHIKKIDEITKKGV